MAATSLAAAVPWLTSCAAACRPIGSSPRVAMRATGAMTPWYAGGQGVIAPVARIATRGLDPIGLHAAAQLVNQGTAAANDVAAIPSLHTAFAVLVAAWFWPRVPARYRW